MLSRYVHARTAYVGTVHGLSGGVWVPVHSLVATN